MVVAVFMFFPLSGLWFISGCGNGMVPGDLDPGSPETFTGAVSARVAATSVPQDSADQFKSYLQSMA